MNKKIKASFFPFRLGGGIIFTCKLATIRAISFGTSRMVPAVYFMKITGKNEAAPTKAGIRIKIGLGEERLIVYFLQE